VPISLSDELEIVSKSDNNAINCVEKGEKIAQNTSKNAAKTLQKLFRIDKGCTIITKKHIPFASGMGGSSTNAAGVLKTLNKLWNINATNEELIEIAKSIGADAPFFIRNVPCIVEGIGEKVTTLPKLGLDMHIVVITPNFSLNTADVFKKYVELKSGYSAPIEHNAKAFIDEIKKGTNDLINAAIALNSGIGNLLFQIKSFKGCEISSMTGSGSSCYGIFYSKVDAQECLKHFAKSFFAHYEYVSI
jgi:4-diphosphocytidyl-2-C-methyl-D-erythritol kinase